MGDSRTKRLNTKTYEDWSNLCGYVYILTSAVIPAGRFGAQDVKKRPVKIEITVKLRTNVALTRWRLN